MSPPIAVINWPNNQLFEWNSENAWSFIVLLKICEASLLYYLLLVLSSLDRHSACKTDNQKETRNYVSMAMPWKLRKNFVTGLLILNRPPAWMFPLKGMNKVRKVIVTRGTEEHAVNSVSDNIPWFSSHRYGLAPIFKPLKSLSLENKCMKKQ